MATKQFRIGERVVKTIGAGCTAGIIKADIFESTIQIYCIDRNSNREVLSAGFSVEYRNAYRNLDEFLNGVTSSYHADQIMTWLKSKVKFKKESWFCRFMTQVKSKIEKESCF